MVLNWSSSYKRTFKKTTKSTPDLKEKIIAAMKRIVNKAKNNKEAEKWDIHQQISMTPEERQKAAKELKKKFYGANPPDVRK